MKHSETLETGTEKREALISPAYCLDNTSRLWAEKEL